MSEPAHNINHQKSTINLVQKDNYKQFICKDQKSPLKIIEVEAPEHSVREKRINPLELRKSLMVLRALNHKLRQTIISLIKDNDTLTVTEIFVRLRMEQSAVSQHLRILRGAGIVNTEKKGKHIYYSVNKERMDQLSNLTASIANQ